MRLLFTNNREAKFSLKVKMIHENNPQTHNQTNKKNILSKLNSSTKDFFTPKIQIYLNIIYAQSTNVSGLVHIFFHK